MTRRGLAVVIAIVAVTAVVVVLSLVLPRGDAETSPVQASASPTPSSSATPSPIASPKPGDPSRLRIPAIEVDAPVMAVGTTKDNAQQVPTSLDVTGWWRDGARPGEPGNAVVVGHTASADAGVFDPLVDVEEGDDIVVDSEGEEYAFTVTKIATVPVENFGDVAGEVYRKTGRSGLVLMTCGDWNGKDFETTVIVTAEAANAPDKRRGGFRWPRP